jgi:hypothetical protein
MDKLLTFIGHKMGNKIFDHLRTFQSVYNFFQLHPAISLSEFSREIGKNRNYMTNLFKSDVITEKQFKKLLPYLQKYGYAEDVL